MTMRRRNVYAVLYRYEVLGSIASVGVCGIRLCSIWTCNSSQEIKSVPFISDHLTESLCAHNPL